MLGKGSSQDRPLRCSNGYELVFIAAEEPGSAYRLPKGTRAIAFHLHKGQRLPDGAVPGTAVDIVGAISEPIKTGIALLNVQLLAVDGRTVKGIDFFSGTDKALLEALQDPKVNIAGVRRADLLAALGPLSPHRLSRQLRRFRHLGVIKRVAGTYRYYLTKAGRAATAAACRITAAVVIPAII